MVSITSEVCPVCGYELGFPAWKDESASDVICSCCYIHFGNDDWAEGKPEARKDIYDTWRKRWILEGMKWRGKSKKPPQGWNSIEQLKAIGIAA
jgi:hypothetical protein